MIWEAVPEPDIAARLRAFGVESVVFSPVANAPASGDYLSVMHNNIDNLNSVPVEESS